jgi:hypothetical protein
MHSTLAAWHLNMGKTGSPETSVTNYQSSLHNTPEERRSQNEEIFDCLANETSKWQANQSKISLNLYLCDLITYTIKPA